MTSTDQAHQDFSIAIVGGGIAGLTLAIALLNKQIPIHIYEAAPAFAEIGAGVSFGVNAQRAMALIDPRIRDGYENIDTRNASPEKHDTWFDFRRGTGEPDVICEVRSEEVGQSSVHRAHFLDALVKLIPDDVAHFGKRLTDITPHDDCVELHFADGTTVRHTAIIGCDGVRSRTREILLGPQDYPNYAPTFTGKYAYRALISMSEAASSLGDELARNSQMYLGPHGHILTFPIEKGRTMNVVAFHSSPSWPHTKWVLPSPSSSSGTYTHHKDFEGWGEPVRKIVGMMREPDVWALFDHPGVERYWRGRLCVIGDAAHASTPHQGAGAGQAVEDAYILSEMFGHRLSVLKAQEGWCTESVTGDDLEKVFTAYDHVRRHRSQKVVTTSREAGMIYDFEGEGAGSDVEKVRDAIVGRYDWIWRVDLEGEVRRGVEFMMKGSGAE
ncbi:hypothetical protein G7K_6150-t1 [Saitoella complicata NRRL Y-17804]|uniref:FAD-binding domain-containing protein n=1 Tax=Saitoella complicata (strain BCRC 22490 / CBS 7301 / JCM 7358 / NBRC 10748 / NRRL Y-17804) TaxID=698492 RepID=A0A0E9NQJ0_SAICN|nr:hypothetical protein G7K_6150-t1 [Saitoella complicata NRRL Y-17804]